MLILVKNISQFSRPILNKQTQTNTNNRRHTNPTNNSCCFLSVWTVLSQTQPISKLSDSNMRLIHVLLLGLLALNCVQVFESNAQLIPQDEGTLPRFSSELCSAVISTTKRTLLKLFTIRLWLTTLLTVLTFALDENTKKLWKTLYFPNEEVQVLMRIQCSASLFTLYLELNTRCLFCCFFQ